MINSLFRLIYFLFCSKAFAAISAAAQWEVRSTGNDTNGGFYVSGGTDYSQQDSPQTAVTDGVTNGSTTITSATAAFTTAMVGNGVYVAGGTGSITAGWYQIVTRNSATSITVDRATGLTTGTGVTLRVGGGLASVVPAFANYVLSNTIWVKNGSYTISANIDKSGIGATTPTSTTQWNRFYGYNTTHGDAPTGSNRPTITATGSVTTMFLFAQGWETMYIIFDCGTTVADSVFGITQSWNVFKFCKLMNFKLYSISLQNQYIWLMDCEITGGTSAASYAVYSNGNNYIANCWIHDNACTGIECGPSGGFLTFVHNCVISNNTGASSDGIRTAYSNAIINNTIYGNGRDGIRNSDGYIMRQTLNNILAGNAGYGMRFTTDSSSLGALLEIDYNAYWNNTTGAITGITQGVHSVTLSVDPFTNKAGNDFTLNNTAGGGAACKGAGYSPSFPGGVMTSVVDIGALQAAAGAAAAQHSYVY